MSGVYRLAVAGGFLAAPAPPSQPSPVERGKESQRRRRLRHGSHRPVSQAVVRANDQWALRPTRAQYFDDFHQLDPCGDGVALGLWRIWDAACIRQGCSAGTISGLAVGFDKEFIQQRFAREQCKVAPYFKHVERASIGSQ